MLKPSPKIIQAARDLRKRQTQAEKILWNILRDRQFKNFKFRRQHPFGRFIADFFCYKANLIVEIDGPIYNIKDQKEYDLLRTELLKQQGLKILRFKNKEVLLSPDKVLRKIKSELTSPLHPSPDRRGVGGEGFSLIETIVGIALLLIVFVSIFGVAQIGIKLVGQSGARITATALANQKIELSRNLPYNQVGTIGGIPNGSILETETMVRNKITFTVKTTIVFVDDSFDNLFPNDPLPTDYKRIKVKVFWPGILGNPVFLQTDIAPKGIETTGSGGIVSILVFDANGQLVPQADIQIENTDVSPPINVHYQTNDQGRLFIPGSPVCNDCYKITATKTGYSLERTYAVNEQVRGITLATPNKPLVSVLEDKMSEVSFTIDRLSAKTVETIKYVEEKTLNGSFDEQNQISDPITPTGLVSWSKLSWTSTSTDIHFQLLYATSGDWVLIPDSDFTVSPVDISQLDPFQYSSIKVRANLPSDWQITWFSSDTSTPVSNVSFIMQGAKTLGLDPDGNPVYKYQKSFNTDNNGQITISNLEWDSYKITINGLVTGYDIANSLPPQPININPNTNQTTALKLAEHQSNTLLVTIKDSGSQPLIGASVQLYKTGYARTKLTTNSGQSFFSPLSLATYNLEVKMSGYQDWLGQVSVSGQKEQLIILTPP